MPTTITLKNIPDDVYDQLKTAAATNRRSINSEAIVCIESALAVVRPAPQDRLARARRLRESLGSRRYAIADVEDMKHHGRK